jgi:hypothetical protein
MHELLESEEWIIASDKLQSYVVDFNIKAIQANKGFQI